MKNYFIKESYQHRNSAAASNEIGQTDQCQDEVYLYASKLPAVETVLDVGTGGGFKLVKYFSERFTLGLDTEFTVKGLRHRYPEKDWCAVDLAEDTHTGYDLLICADVIEHLEDPDILLDFIKRCEPKQIVLSTPDRDRLQVAFHNGPPKNPEHCREWSAVEFLNYMNSAFTLKDFVQPEEGHSTQFVLATLKEK